MNISHRTVGRLGVASLIGALAALSASPASAACEAGASTCSVGTGAISTKVTKRLGTEIDSGWMEKGSVKVRARFTIDPVGSDPIIALDMPKGAGVEASWKEAGFIDLKPITGQDAQGSMAVHYTLTPSLEASIYGITISKNATELVNMIPGASFNYDSKAQAPFAPWGFAGASVPMPAPALDQSTIFSIGWDTLGVDPGTAEGSLALQASAKPTFKYMTKSVALEGGTINAADGTTRIPAVDADAMDVSAYVQGEVSFTGTLDVKPVVTVDSVAGYSTYGLVKLSFSAVSKDMAAGQTPTPVSFQRTTIHVPLPNVKVPGQGIDMGMVKAGGSASKTITIANTGEMGAVFTVTSSDPQFTVPGGQIHVDSKGQYNLVVGFSPSGGAASATITVKSNDPDAPEQSFKVGANGATVEDTDNSGKSNGGNASLPQDDSGSGSSGCSAAPNGSKSTGGLAGLALGLGLVLAARRRRNA